MGVTQRQTEQLQPRRLPERVPGSFLLQQLQTFSSTSQTPRTTVKMTVSKIRQNYHEDCEALINKQINMEFYASYVYLSMSSYFSRDDQALPGFAAHFAKESEEEREHGMKLMAYQSKRGGRCVFQDIAKPVSMEWGTCLEAMEAALELEKMVNQSLIELTKAADDKGDSNLSDFVDEFLEDQVASIKSIGDTITKLKRVGDGLGLFLFDKEMAARTLNSRIIGI